MLENELEMFPQFLNIFSNNFLVSLMILNYHDLFSQEYKETIYHLKLYGNLCVTKDHPSTEKKLRNRILACILASSEFSMIWWPKRTYVGRSSQTILRNGVALNAVFLLKTTMLSKLQMHLEKYCPSSLAQQ